MNYLEQIKGFWITQEINQLGTSEIAMYFHLLEIWNKTGWIGSFYRNNYKVMADLSIRSPKTLQSLRDKLKAAGILSFKTKNGDANVEYTMIDLGNFYRGKGVGRGAGSVPGEGVGEGIHNINQKKPNQISSSGGKPPAPKKKSSKKKKKEEPPEPYWQKLVSTWDDFNVKKFLEKNPGGDPKDGKITFEGPEARDFKKIIQRLKKRAADKNIEWTEENAVTRLLFFLEAAKKIDWIGDHFLLSNIVKQFDTIIINLNSNGAHQQRIGKPIQQNRKSAGAEQLLDNLRAEATAN